ncbi:assimilatory sulfite reductase (NADPH) flavoprotein subunit [Glaciecola sp. XM2]|uniref:assimilatory sulfite reductase (NADPH) flavoprotein subunit n=1 Tax=Glaciecola sp. XM2 TaxID=1914931 RepID=UPI001BDE8940|nr:assimilatory sulfite reductase (NADPH) flavoprotein subunit [Glaciecola sp. XM2]MBT1451137.1 assimilatory sulfite reductase (NADPH) flavoprotein subunit [Glaciecola sp. XM2]
MSSQQNKIPLTLLDSTQLSQITQAVSGLDREQLIWASGYLAGLSQSDIKAMASVNNAVAVSQEQSVLTVMYGSQTGNAKHAAISYADSVKAQGIKTNVVSMADYKPRKIKDESHLVLFVSTHGEGDAPDDAVEFHEFLASKKAPNLDKLKYAVVALGDTSYEFFCQTGKDFDARLAGLGAQPLIERLDCDVEYEQELAAWTIKINEILATVMKTSPVEKSAPIVAQPSAVAYTKQNPYIATLNQSLKITGRDSVKDIRHVEISLEDSGIVYQPGDALGVFFLNNESLVSRILTATNNQADDKVLIKDVEYQLFDALTEHLELTLSYPGFVKAYQLASNSEALAALLNDSAALRAFLAERQIVDIVEQFPEDISAQALVDALRPITPRLYSIASSQSEVEDEVHLTVAHVDYEAFGTRHQGGASGYLCTGLEEGGQVKVYTENNDNFRLPSNADTPIIMVGPGTGIAPFRAFMQQRDALEAQGKNWLFFGNPNFTQDFLYQTEWQGYLKSGLLTKISLAFSRDQAEKIYVQDRLLENGKEVYEWLESGAHFYVCGDALRMAKDVETALLKIIQTFGQKTEQEAKQYLLAIRKEKRYQKDVY